MTGPDDRETSMADYKLYAFGESGNCYKVALMLALTNTPWERLPVDYFNGETRGEAFRALNEMGEAPVLLHDGKVLSQSGVILDYLAEKTGKFGPGNEDERREILRWMLFDNHKFTSYLATYRFLKAFLPQAPDPNVVAFLKGRFDAAAAVVEKHLAGSKFMVGDTPTIADFSVAGYVFYPVEEHGYDWGNSHPNIHAWTERVRALPGWKDPYDLMPGARIKPLR
jgi:glutathione S-transferase